ncbi:STAS domain-containing protein [uncultured Maribacter sp.]|uniref:STAS domain-containing protein n=1 Tax=uncultured Maribacter sp. TaxID=431308 RepID=UPI00260C9651|nr:STAS domain-containing protein [uncultured Maribacter sp.]
MAIEIKENSGMFEILGNISSQNMTSLKNYFESIIPISESIILNIEKVGGIDKSGAYMLEKLYKGAVEKNKIISIIGRQNKKIASIMKNTKTHYILSNDRV